MRKPKKYRLVRDSALEAECKAGSVVYELIRHDYGLASDDTRALGVVHISVTTDPEGQGYSFTIPRADLEEVP